MAQHHTMGCLKIYYHFRKGWFSNTSFTTGLKTLPTFRPDTLVFFIFVLKKTRASGRNVGKVFNPVVKLVLENQPFLMPEPAEKPSLHQYITTSKYGNGDESCVWTVSYNSGYNKLCWHYWGSSRDIPSSLPLPTPHSSSTHL